MKRRRPLQGQRRWTAWGVLCHPLRWLLNRPGYRVTEDGESSSSMRYRDAHTSAEIWAGRVTAQQGKASCLPGRATVH